MKLLFLCVFLVFTTIYLLLTRKRFFLSINTLFIVANTIMFSGSLFLLDLNLYSDILHLFIMIISHFLFIMTDLVLNSFVKSDKTLQKWNENENYILDSSNYFNFILKLLFVVSLSLSISYYIRVGYNLFILAFKVFLNGGLIEDFSSYRLAAYTGENYYAPGYINQFKNTIFPLVNLFWVLGFIFYKKKKFLVITIITTPLALLLILGTGQRGAFAYMALIYAHAFFVISPKRKRKKTIIFSAITIILIFSLSSIFLGRGINSVGDIDVKYLLGALPKRIFYDNQISSVEGFRYIYYFKDIEFAKDWLITFANILPGQGALIIDNEIHRYMYGTLRGTCPLSLWGSVYYNFGLIGIIVFPSILAMFNTGCYYWFIRRKKTIFNTICFSGTYIIMGTWIAGAPISRINIGLLTIMIMYFICKKLPNIINRNILHKNLIDNRLIRNVD